jgi:hypothetical protein
MRTCGKLRGIETGPREACDLPPTPDGTPVSARGPLMTKYLIFPAFANIGCYGLPEMEARYGVD